MRDAAVPSSLDSHDEIANYEKTKQSLQEQVQAVSDECCKAENLRELLKAQIEQSKTAHEQAEAARMSVDQETRVIDSAVESLETELADTKNVSY